MLNELKKSTARLGYELNVYNSTVTLMVTELMFKLENLQLVKDKRIDWTEVFAVPLNSW